MKPYAAKNSFYESNSQERPFSLPGRPYSEQERDVKEGRANFSSVVPLYHALRQTYGKSGCNIWREREVSSSSPFNLSQQPAVSLRGKTSGGEEFCVSREFNPGRRDRRRISMLTQLTRSKVN